MPECTEISKCSFYRKYSKRSSAAWRGFIRQYCFQGNRDAVCSRLDSAVMNSPDEADIMPSGQRVPLFFLDLP